MPLFEKGAFFNDKAGSELDSVWSRLSRCFSASLSSRYWVPYALTHPALYPKILLSVVRSIFLTHSLLLKEKKGLLPGPGGATVCVECTFPEHKGIPDSPAAEMHFKSPSLLWRCMQRFPRGNK